MFDIELTGTFIIAGIFILSILGMNFQLLETGALNNMQTMAQENVAEVASIIEFDLRKAGYGVPDTTTAILAISDTTIRFLADIYQNGTPDTINYRLSSRSDAVGTENPNDRYLYRSVNGSENDVAIGLTDLRFDFYSATGNQTTVLDSIRTIRVGFTVQTLFAYNGQYGSAAWSNQISPKNLGEI
ncbi:MAG TPA: hypothetical protein DHW42_07760 [Candidatus Marinimicrobia bacterium]|nr:hypothetical protein [Candidatus Neomarinimicrobiota bacterium]